MSSPHVQLAKEVLEGYVRDGETPEPSFALPKELTDIKAGVFVSLKIKGELRGCIGTISPVTGCVADEITQNAVSAGTKDPRFPPVRPEELESLEYSVDVLAAPEPCEKKDLDVIKYGVIVTRGYRRGLLLPNLEGVEDAERQVSIALSKAGIGSGEPYALERFEVTRFT